MSKTDALFLRRIWTAMEEAGFGDVSRNGIGPHVTLAITSAFDRTSREASLRSFASSHEPCAVTFDNIGRFGAGTMFFGIAKTPALRALHRCVPCRSGGRAA